MKKYYRSAGHNGKHSSQKKISRKGTTASERQSSDQIQLPLDWNDLVEMLQDSLHCFAVEVGLVLASKLLEEAVARVCGKRYEHQSKRLACRYGRQQGTITMDGQKLHIRKPRARYSNDDGEVALESYALMQREEAMPEAALQRMVRGVSCRDYEGVVDQAREGFGIKRSSVSRHFVRASAQSVKEFAERRFDETRIVAIFIDGVEYAGQTMVCALGLSSEGKKLILSVREGATENAEVVTALLEELRDRGVDTSVRTLFVLDGSKALSSAVRRVWGKNALIQRCQIHKKRNVKAHLPEKHWGEFDRMVGAAYQENDYQEAVKQLQVTARWLDRINPDAASSLREGMEQTLTVIRLGVRELLRKTLSSTNPIESAFDTCRKVTGRVKRWREGDMRKRWCVAGLMRAEAGFRRVRGFKEIPALISALDSHSKMEGNAA